MRGGHLTQELGDVLQHHDAGHHLERRWYGDVDERVLLNRGELVAGVQLDLVRIQTELREPAEVIRSREPVGTGGGARPARLWIDDTALGKPGGRLNTGEDDASSILVASSWSSLETGDSGMIQGGMNLVWTTVPLSYGRYVTGCSAPASMQPQGYTTVSRASPAVKPTKHAHLPPRLTLGRRHDVSNELIHREPSGAWPEAPPPGF